MKSRNRRLQPARRNRTRTKCPSLPAEIWQLIFTLGGLEGPDVFDDTDDNFDYPTMASICRSCTLFCDLVRPSLYSRFASHVSDDNCCFYSVAKFTWAISTNPLLASMVRRVNIEGACDLVTEPRMRRRDTPDHPMAPALIAKAAELGMDFKYLEVYTHRHGGNVGFDLVALLLAQLPNLYELHLKWFDTETRVRMPEPRNGWPWTKSIRRMFLNPFRTSNPIDFRSPPSPSARYSLTRVLPLLSSAGSLEVLSPYHSTGPQLALPFENLRDATLLRCEFSFPQLQNLLQKCTRLRKFVYLLISPDVNMGRSSGATPLQVIEALAPSWHSLEVLGLDFRNRPAGLRGRITSLERLVSLKTLFIDLTSVWDPRAGYDPDFPHYPDVLFTTLLPESIEEVALFGLNCDAEELNFALEVHVDRMASERAEKGRFKKLERLNGRGFWPFKDDLDPSSVIEDWSQDVIVPRITLFNDAKEILGDNGVEVSFDGEEVDEELDFSHIMYYY